MLRCSQLPCWVSYLQALAVPILAVVVAFFGVLVASRQARIARDKFQSDEFFRKYDKRFEVYTATREFLASVFRGGVTEDSIHAYGLTALDAQFLFDEPVFRYLRELHQRIAFWHDARSRMEKAAAAEQAEFRRISDDQMQWIIQQGDEATGFATRFAPFLKPQEIRRPHWRFWPVRVTNYKGGRG
jgi:hypothetical protein